MVHGVDIGREDIAGVDEMDTAVTCEYCEKSNYIIIVGCGIVLLWLIALLYICWLYGQVTSTR